MSDEPIKIIKIKEYLILFIIENTGMKSQHSNKPYHKNVNPNHPGFKIRPPHDVFPEDI